MIQNLNMGEIKMNEDEEYDEDDDDFEDELPEEELNGVDIWYAN